MAKEMKKVDVVTVGIGYTGGIAAVECAKAGLKVVGLERGPRRGVEDFMEIHDEWRYGINYGLMQDLSKETIVFQNTRKMQPLPMRRLGSFLLGDGLGGAGVHWNGLTFRFSPYDFEIATRTRERYGDKLGKEYLLQDWALTYDEMEPYFTTFEKANGISGEAISPFDGKRSEPYPLGPLIKTPMLQMFERAANKCGWHPYMLPSANLSDAYTNPDGAALNPCMYCAYCERFACEFNAKASPLNTSLPIAEKTGNYEARCNANVVEILHKGGKATGVRYIDTISGEEFIQPAEIVVLSSFVMNNAKLLMLAGIGEQYDPDTGRGTLGRSFCYQITPNVTGFFKDQMNVFAGAGALGIGIDDFNADNFDHDGLDFIHGGLISVLQSGARPIAANAVPKGTPSWGAEFKKASTHNFTRAYSIGGQGASIAHRENYLSLDNTYKDAYGLPLLRVTYNFTAQDRAMFKFLTARMEELIRAFDPQPLSTISKEDAENYNIVPYQTTHTTGGTVAGKSPENSVVNSYMQHWDCENLFVVGAGNFAHNGGCNPTGTVGALAYRCAEGLLKYAKRGGSLV